MNFNEVLELVKTVSGSELTSFEYEEGNQKIVMHAGSGENTTGANVAAVENKATMVTTTSSAIIAGNQVVSPLVGRFYAAPSEEAEPYVKVGDTVKAGQVLAIVEAMKLMNEIESDFDGVVQEILVQDGEAVEYGQPLFVLL